MPEKTNNSPADNQSPESPEEMNAEELDAFNKIMGEIEGSRESEDEAEKSPAESQTDVEDDFSAELEKVVKEADTAEPDAAGKNEEELDEDQQKAFESIMAQIGGGGEDANEAEAAQNEDEDDFSAELERVVKAADEGEGKPEPAESRNEITSDEPKPTENQDGEASGAADADDTLSQDQQDAFESIMAQIEGGKDAEQEAPSAESQSDKNPGSEAAAEETIDKPPAALEDESEDITADIEDLLKEVKEEGDAKISSEPEPEEIVTAEKTAEKKPAESQAPSSDAAGSQPADAREEAPEQKEEPAGTTRDPAPPSPEEKTPVEALKPAPASPGKAYAKPVAAVPQEAARTEEIKWKKRALYTASAALLLLVLLGYSHWRQFRPNTDPVDTSRVESRQPAAAVDVQPSSLSQSNQSAQNVPPTSDQTRLKNAAEQLDRLRSELQAKREEIEELRTYYQTGIGAEMQGILDVLRTQHKDKITYSAAIADPRISLGLAAIQRRETYIRKLMDPLETLDWNSDELRYLSRKAELLAMLAAKTSDIDVDGFTAGVETTIGKHRQTLAELNIDAILAEPKALEAIWRDIVGRMPGKKAIPTDSKSKPETAKADDAVIAKRICSGDFSQKHKLTELTTEAARCLAKWKGKDLFLNELKELTPGAARHLAAWEGEWLGLNGLRELSPETAAHLARWRGKGLSLNGLSRLSPRVVAILSEWQGRQIELVSVKHMAHWENPGTRLFLSEEMVRKGKATRN
jgi:hypothetical protein